VLCLLPFSLLTMGQVGQRKILEHWITSASLALPGRRLNVEQLRWSGCKRFTSGHGVAGTLSGVEAAIHGGDELWLRVGIEVSEWDQNLALNTWRSRP
jgi:hypothetical protein